MRHQVATAALAAALVFGGAATALAVHEDGSGCRSGSATGAASVLACVSSSMAFVETPLGTGSGILVEGSYVVTNAHVVDPFGTVTLVFEGGERHERVPVKGADLDADLALVGPIRTRRKPLPLGDPASLAKGDDLFLIGYPGEVDDSPDATISRGILSRTRRAKGFGLTFVQTDAAIGGGQSGGALVDGRGHVVGVSGYLFADEFALALSGPDARRSIGRILKSRPDSYVAFPESPGTTAGSFHLADSDALQVLTMRTGRSPETVRLTLPAAARPSLLVGDVEGGEVYFENQEAVEAAIERSGGDPAPQAAVGADEAVAPGVFEFDVPADTYAVIVVGTRRTAGADMTFTSSVPLGRYDDTDDGRPIAVGERLRGVIDPLEANGDTFVVDLAEGDEVEIFAGSATGDVGFAVRGPAQQAKDALVVDDSELGMFLADAREVYVAETSGPHRITVFSSDGRPTGYVLEVSPN